MQAPPARPTEAGPITPAGTEIVRFDQFDGVSTQSGREGCPQNKAYWLDGFFPVGPRRLRTLPDIGASIYATTPATIVFFRFYNIGAAQYCIAFLTDGSAVQIRLSNGATTTVLPTGTILSPVMTNIGVRQYGNQYLIIVASQPNGYWIWDGALLYTAGTLGPQITLTSGGTAYKTVPSIAITGGHGGGATAVAQIANGSVINANITNPGSGYQVGDSVTLTFSGGNSGGTGGVLTANLSHTAGGSGASFRVFVTNAGAYYYVSAVTVLTSGSGYDQFTVINTTATNYGVQPTQPCILVPIISAGAIVGVTIANGGKYGAGLPNIVATAADAGGYMVSSVTVNNGGSGYSASANVTVSGGGSPVSQAVITLNLNGTGVITSCNVVNGGLYGSNTAPTLVVNDPVNNATATATLMPFGVSGTAVESYAGHVWVVDGPACQFTAPGSVTDFATSDGGGSFTSQDPFLKVGYVQLLQTNGFLYFIGDSSVSYISNVQTAIVSAVPTTTYSYQNADPQVGSPYPYGCQYDGRSITIANSWGVHVGYGASFEKVSEDLDGVWDSAKSGTAPNTVYFAGNQLSCGNAVIYNKRCFVTLATIVDPVDQAQQNKLMIQHDSKWFTSLQSVTLTYISSQEINSQITLYGTDGTSIYPLFQTPGTGFSKTWQTRLDDKPGIEWDKAQSRLWALLNVFNDASPNITVDIDNEASFSAATYTLTPSGTGYYGAPPAAVGQHGLLTGMTVETNIADMAIVYMSLAECVEQYRG